MRSTEGSRYLWEKGKSLKKEGDRPVTMFGFALGTHHPAYEVLRHRLPRLMPPYAWYIRVPDLPAFIKHIAPVLEKNIARSLIPNHTGEIKLGFYRGGLRLVFEQGRLTTVENWNSTPSGDGDAAFPNLTFFELVFGLHTLDELTAAHPDCWYDNRDDVRVLLSTLFPKQPSHFDAIA